MKIESTGKPLGTVQSTEARLKAVTGSPRTEGGEKVELSSLSSTLQRAEAAMSNVSEVDKSRVAEIKQAISEGRFKIDAGRIADGLLSSVRDMLDSQSQQG